MKAIKIIVLAVILLPFITNAQNPIYKKIYKNSEWINGYVIPRAEKTEFSEDTIFCKISFANNISGAHFYKIKLLLDNEEVIKLQASEIISFTRGIEYFESGYFVGNYSFAKRIIYGKVSLFGNRQSSVSPSGAGSVTGTVASNSYSIYYFRLYNSKEMIHFPTGLKYKKFIPFMETYFGDDKELMQLVIDKELKPNDVIEIINHYNKN